MVILPLPSSETHPPQLPRISYPPRLVQVVEGPVSATSKSTVKLSEVHLEPLVPQDEMDLDQVVPGGRESLIPRIAPNLKLGVS
jgi:hypothetical protein